MAGMFPEWFSYFQDLFIILSDPQDLLLLFQQLWIVFSQTDVSGNGLMAAVINHF
jgi:hypothetical protein